MQSPGPNSKPPASTSTPVANGENAVNQDKALSPNPTPTEILTNLKRWQKRATKGDTMAQQQLRELLDRPDCFQLFRDLASHVRAALSQKLGGDDWLAKQLLERELNRVRAELLGPAPTAVERLLAERIAIGWLEVHAAEFRLAFAQPDFRDHWQRQVGHAHRRFLSALRLLTAIRRLPRPAVQVNIGEQQVNVSG
jgi:hypothetical protein